MNRSLLFLFCLCTLLTGCLASNTSGSGASPTTPETLSTESTLADACPVTEPAWVKPPDDPAVQGTAEFGHYFVNEDRSMWASAWWAGQEEQYLRASAEGIKMGWFRPAGAALEITGQRIDGQAPPLETRIPCCYPTRFQAVGMLFPTEGCWEVAAKAAESELSFVVWVAP